MLSMMDLYQLVKTLDWEAIESARDRVSANEVASLASYYTSLKSWDEKAAVICLVQDTLDPILLPMMKDFLAAPPGDDDIIWMGKLTALLHLDGSFDRFKEYSQGGPNGVEGRARERLASFR